MIVVGQKYQINLGYIARVSKNFGIRRLFLVSPRAKPTGRKAIMYAKHAHDLLEGAKIYRNLDEATRDCSMVLGTTGIWEKARSDFGRVYLLGDAIGKIKKSGIRKSGTIGLVIGRDDTGLTAEELEKCDMVAYIGTNPMYPVLNVSHALAIMLYSLTGESLSTAREGMTGKSPDKREIGHLFSIFDSLIQKKRIRNRKAVMNVFKRIISNSQPSSRELHALITALK